jgi:type II secretory pathway pseudopilin PulG
MQFRRCVPEQGFTLTEAVVAAAISALFLSSLFTMNLSSMETIRSAKESTVASQVLQQRLESMRIANWHQITDAAWIRDNLLNIDAAGGEQLKNLVETVMLVPYGAAASATLSFNALWVVATIVTENANLLWRMPSKLSGQSITRVRLTITL